MWSDLTTVDAVIDCRRPFSFYFGIVKPYWLTPDSNNLPLHRICTLARKQGATWVVVESAISRPDVRSEIDALDNAKGGGGAANAVLLSFFSSSRKKFNLSKFSEEDFLGQALVINFRPSGSPDFEVSYVYEAMLATPSLRSNGQAKNLLNNFLCPADEFSCQVKGKEFKVRAIYYAQQNGITNVCAHAALRMALRDGSNLTLTSGHINTFLSITPPLYGLSLQNIIDVIGGQGREVEIIDCISLSPDDYIPILSSIVESGDRALLVFTTGHVSGGGTSSEHVVPIFGHTRNSDEWHPQAIPMYAGPASAQHYRSSSWVDHFIIHDDNFGPYYTLSSQALEFDPDVKAHWIVSIRMKAPGLLSSGAEAVASLQLRNILPSLAPLATGQWFDYITQSPWTYVFRTILIARTDYENHLRLSVGHDGSGMDAAELSQLHILPDQFWMVEFSLPSLFTGNRSKLGEVLISTDAPTSPLDVDTMTLGFRLPNVLLLRDTGSGKLQHGPSGLRSHSEYFRIGSSNHVW